MATLDGIIRWNIRLNNRWQHSIATFDGALNGAFDGALDVNKRWQHSIAAFDRIFDGKIRRCILVMSVVPTIAASQRDSAYARASCAALSDLARPSLAHRLRLRLHTV